VLVVSCPCALSLATPATLACTAAALARRGVYAVRPDAITTLARANAVVFDKTGTLTSGELHLIEARAPAPGPIAAWLDIAAALERGSDHPIARAFAAYAAPRVIARELHSTIGCGVEGEVGGRRYRLGRPDWACAWYGGVPTSSVITDDQIVL